MPKLSEYPLVTPLTGDEAFPILKPSGSGSDDENRLAMLDDIATFVLSQDSNTGGGGNAFGTIAVSGQSDVVADQANDTLTLVAGSNITLTTSAAGDSVTIASTGGSSGWTEVVAASDQNKASDTTLATDAELFFTMTANKLYAFEASILYVSTAGGTSPDFKCDFNGPATLTGQVSYLEFITTADGFTTAPSQSALSSAGTFGTAATPRLFLARGWAYSTAGGSGSSGLQFRWAQNTTNVSNTTRLAGSILRYRQLTP